MGLQRQYLSALGIEYFVPRFILPGAAPSVASLPVVELPPINDVVAAPSADESSADASASPPSAARTPPRAALPVLDDSDVRARPVPRVVAAPAVGCANPVFRASIVDSGIGLLLVAAAPSTGLDDDAKRLLANIARAVARHFDVLPALQFSATDFHWPMLKMSGIKQDADAARDAFSAAISARLEKSGGHAVVIFGEQLLGYFDRQLCGAGSLTQLDAATLEDLQQQPAAKAALWQKLRLLQLSGI